MNNAGIAAGIGTDGSKIYVIGRYTDGSGVIHSGYWSDIASTPGLTSLTPLVSGQSSVAYGLTMIGGSRYMPGYQRDASSHFSPGYFFNDTWHALSRLDSTQDSSVFALFGDAYSHIYAGGFSTNSSGVQVAGYWIDDAWTGLTPIDSTKNSWVKSIYAY